MNIEKQSVEEIQNMLYRNNKFNQNAIINRNRNLNIPLSENINNNINFYNINNQISNINNINDINNINQNTYNNNINNNIKNNDKNYFIDDNLMNQNIEEYGIDENQKEILHRDFISLSIDSVNLYAYCFPKSSSAFSASSLTVKNLNRLFTTESSFTSPL
jgi:hypothetical protein